MPTIVTRSTKGAPLQWAEVDANFSNLNGAINAIYGGSGAANVGYNAETVKSVLDSLTNARGFNPAAVAITGGTATLSKAYLGTNAPSGDDSALLIARGLTSSITTGYHAVRDESTYNGSGGGLLAYASYDSIMVLSGSAHYNHMRSFQARPQFTGSGPIDEISGLTVQATHSGTGVVALNFGVRISDPQGTGPITNNYGIWIDPMVSGTSGNFAIYSSSTALASYHAGLWQTGGDILAAGKGTFGGALSCTAFDSSGTPAIFGTNGGLGVYGFASNPYARIQAYSDSSGTGKSLSLNSAGGNVLVGTTTDNAVDKFQINGGLAAGTVKLGGDTILCRDASNTLALRNGVNAQAFNLYNTYTDAGNYERGVFDWSSAPNTLVIGSQKAGTGALRNTTLTATLDINFASTQGSNVPSIKWTIDTSNTVSLYPVIPCSIGKSTNPLSKIYIDYTNTGTVGAVTINKAAGRVNIAAGGTSLVVTNSFVTAASKVFAQVSQADGTAYIKNVVPAAGSFTITLGAAATAQVSVDFFVVNTD